MTIRTDVEVARPGNTPPVPVVWKFGGTCLADHAGLRAIAERMVDAQRSGCGVVAVLSATGTSTAELTDLAHGMSARPPRRELDALLAVGESISCALAAMAVAELGSYAVSLTAAQAGIGTDDRHGGARLTAIRPQRIHDALAAGAIVLVAGGQGVSPAGDVTTLGRGGSDVSAVALAAALGASECEIFTDVPAVFTADPRVVPGARRLSSIRPEEMLEMAEAGAAVLQPGAIEIAQAHDVDIHLRSSVGAEEGTWVRREAPDADQPGSTEVAGIAHRRQENRYVVDGLTAGAAAAALAGRGNALGAVVPAGGGIHFTAPGADPADVIAAIAALGTLARMDGELGSVSVVSTGIGRRPEIVACALAALEEAGIVPQLVTTTPGRMTAAVPADRVEAAVGLLHGIFIPAAGTGTVLGRRRPTPVGAA